MYILEYLYFVVVIVAVLLCKLFKLIQPLFEKNVDYYDMIHECIHSSSFQLATSTYCRQTDRQTDGRTSLRPFVRGTVAMTATGKARRWRRFAWHTHIHQAASEVREQNKLAKQTHENRNIALSLSLLPMYRHTQVERHHRPGIIGGLLNTADIPT